MLWFPGVSKGLSLWISLDQSTTHRSQATEPGSRSILVQKRFIRRKCFSCPTPHMAIEGVSLRPKWLDPSKTLSFICSLLGLFFGLLLVTRLPKPRNFCPLWKIRSKRLTKRCRFGSSLRLPAAGRKMYHHSGWRSWQVPGIPRGFVLPQLFIPCSWVKTGFLHQNRFKTT